MTDPGRIVIADDNLPLAGVVFDVQGVPGQTPGGEPLLTLRLGADGPAGRLRLAVDVFLTGWDAQPTPDPRVTFWHGDVGLRGVGADTAAWVDVVAGALAIPDPGPPGGALGRRLCQAAAICFDPARLPETRGTFKLWLGSGDNPDTEAEIFLTVDLPAGQAWFAEKDPGQRGALLAHLRGDGQ